MKLVIDANELFSAIISKGRGKQTKKIDLLFSEKVELFAPSKLLTELEKNAQDIKAKSRFADEDFEMFIELVKLRILFINSDDISDEILKVAKELSPHSKDFLYFAVALKLACPIWSGEKSFKEQSRVKVYNTKDLVNELGI